tara:strand:- start:17194 stop:18054 length:861 start_codon:yes stop_codon:yes gene_type:complete
MLKLFKKVLKIITILIIVLFGALIVLFYRFSTPKSDSKIEKDFLKNETEVYIKHAKFKIFKYRIIATQKEIDTMRPTIVFVHGSIGAAFDFKKYLQNPALNKRANLIAYDRVGYGIEHTGNVQESIAFEAEMLDSLLHKLDTKNTILVGYSYGGPIALASKKVYKKIILLAPAVYSKAEPMPWLLNVYKWKLTEWMLPKIWKAASKEKLSHKADLQNFEDFWMENPSKIISIHGNVDWIVPFENSLYLQEIFSPKQFDLVTLNEAGHGLVWSHFNEINSILLQQLN